MSYSDCAEVYFEVEMILQERQTVVAISLDLGNCESAYRSSFTRYHTVPICSYRDSFRGRRPINMIR